MKQVTFSQDHIAIYRYLMLLDEGQYCLEPATPRDDTKLWTTDQKASFIESLLMGVPMQTIYFAETYFGVKIVFDGYNRLRAIR